MSDVNIQPPSKEEVQNIIQWSVWGIPFAVLLFATYALFNISECPVSSAITYSLLAILFGLRLYIHATKFFNKKESIINILLNSLDAHYLIYVFAMALTGLKTTLFFIDVILMTLGLCFIVIKKVVAPKAGSLEETLSKLSDSYNNCKYISQARAVIEILLIPYLLLASLFLFDFYVLIGFVIYFVGFIAFQLLVDEYHKWVWNWLDDMLTKFANQNDQSFGPYIKQVLNVCYNVPQFAKTIYPNATNFFETIKRKVE